MPKLRVNSFSMSIDGFGAGPDQDLANPLGVGGMGLTNGYSPRARFGNCMARKAVQPEQMTNSLRAAFTTSAPGSSAATCSARSAARGSTKIGKVGGVTTRRTILPSSSSRITRARRSR